LIRIRTLARFGLGLVAGAVLQVSSAPVHAQVVPPPASEVPVPPAPETDTTATPADTVPRDTIKAPIGRALLPAASGVGPRYVWEGDEILASGAYTLTDLLQRIPEITTFRSGWIHSPQVAAVAGDFGRIRLFLDGMELDPIGPRAFGSQELAHVPIWSLQRVVVERAGADVRVHMQTWTVRNTTPFTRTDVYTGNENTDLYRGYYGKRFDNGAIFQAGAEQQGTENVRFGGGGDALSLLARIGMGRANWSVDGFVERRRQHRARQTGQNVPPLAAYDATNTHAYLRAALGRQDRGPWLELLASHQRVKEGSPRVVAGGGVPADTVDTIVSRLQYVATAGYRTGALAFTVTERLRRYQGRSENALSGRVELATRFVDAGAFLERADEANSADAHVRIQPLRFVALSAHGSRREFFARPDPLTSNSFRLEAGVSLGGIWAYGGTLTVDGRVPLPVSPFDQGRDDTPRLQPLFATDYRGGAGRVNATFGGLRGVGWRGFGADTYVRKWDTRDVYLPEYEARTELNFRTRWLSRFPRGDFGFHIAVADEFRSGVDFVSGRTGASHVLWGLLEVRIQRATLTFQTRNPLGRQYFIVPGFEMPRSVSTYGVRWYFWG
jgi:hypothetical protein